MIFKTQNSTYEVDEQSKRIRRLDGVSDPTPNQGEDGAWQEYDTLAPAWGGYIIFWPGGRATLTSIVHEVIEEDR